MLGTNKKVTIDKKKNQMKNNDKKRDEYELKNLGGFERILPSDDPKYKGYLETSKKVWTAFNSSTVTKEDLEKMKPVVPEKRRNKLLTTR
jgi:hypothetical protein